jgi:hypothetical protein
MLMKESATTRTRCWSQEPDHCLEELARKLDVRQMNRKPALGHRLGEGFEARDRSSKCRASQAQ